MTTFVDPDIDVDAAISYPAWMLFWRYAAMGGFGLIAAGGVCHADGLRAQLDNPRQKLVVSHATVLPATLTNDTTSTLYLTGLHIDVSHNAAASLYKEDLIHQQLRLLEPKQSWDGPLIIVTPSHHGPLTVRGTITIQGGTLTTSTQTLVSIALTLPIDDPDRNDDGSFMRGVQAQCDRSADRCCDPGETLCFRNGNHCVYVSEGFNEQRLCQDRLSGKSYDHISNLLVSSDGAHTVYLGSDHCTTNNAIEVTCHVRVVFDGHESDDFEAVNGPCLSPETSELAYEVGEHCEMRKSKNGSREHVCQNTFVTVGTAKAAALPAWCSLPPAMRSFTKAGAR